MPLFSCLSCLKMEIEEGVIENEFDFAEDALDFEIQLSQAREVVFTEPLTKPLAIGSLIVCTGTPDDDVPWFSINIGCGNPDDSKPDMAVHFNVRMPQHYVVRNTRKREKWGSEETTAYRSFPFKFDRPFRIEIVIDETKSLWSVDGEHYCSFDHRSPSPFTATWLQVTGIKDATLTVQTTDVYPISALPYIVVPSRLSFNAESEIEEPLWRPNAIATLDKGIPEGYQLVFHGKLRPLLHSLSIDLTDNPHDWPHPNIHLHVNVRAYDDAHLPRQLVVLNGWFGAWGLERRQRSARIVPGTMTTFRIVRGDTCWSVYSENLVIGELEYRGNANAVKALRIRGDFYPEYVYLCPYSSSPISDRDLESHA